MKQLCLLIFVIMPLLAAGQHESKIKDEKLLKVFSASTEQWKNAYNSKDAGNLKDLYAPEAKYISSHVQGLTAEGRERVLKNFQAGIDGGGHIDSIEILDMQADGRLATLLCRYQATNSGVTVSGRNLLIMKKMNGKWLIIIHMTVV